MKKSIKNKLLKKLSKAESLILKGESDLSCLSEYIQPYFDEEINVTWSTDGAVIVGEEGEVGFLGDFIKKL